MSKVICEVCGTAYPEAANQCPICGCVRSGDTVPVEESPAVSQDSETRAYAYIKGGRFSKRNVKKRICTNQEQEVTEATNEAPEEKKSAIDKLLTAAVIVLLLSIIAVIFYIAVNFFGLELPLFRNSDQPSDPPVITTTEPSAEATTSGTTEAEQTTGVVNVPCEALRLDETTIKLEKIGAVALLNVYTEPNNTTDTVTFMSSNEAVATVTDSGKVVAVGNGEAIITISCGEIKLECTVICSIAEETTAPTTEPTSAPTTPTTAPTTAPTTEPTTAPTTEPKSELTFNNKDLDMTLFSVGESWDLYNGTIARSLITWSSDDESVATFENGKVVAVGPGVTKVHATYNGTKLSCVVRCNFKIDEPTEPTTAPTESTTKPTEGSGDSDTTTKKYKISHEDVTISKGETFELQLFDSEGKAVSVSWHVSDTSCCSVSGSTVTGVSGGTAKVYVEYSGAEYACIVRVKNS